MCVVMVVMSVSDIYGCTVAISECGFVFFFNDTATTEIYTLSLHDALPILAGIDVVVFDIQDVGVRFYTYISTLHYVMQACAEIGRAHV